MIENMQLKEFWLLLVHSPFHLAQAIMGELAKNEGWFKHLLREIILDMLYSLLGSFDFISICRIFNRIQYLRFMFHYKL